MPLSVRHGGNAPRPDSSADGTALPSLPQAFDDAATLPEDCAGCGACCRRNGSPVLLYNSGLTRSDGKHPFRPEGLPQELVRKIDERFLGLNRGEEGPGPCVWYDEGAAACRHYRWRPQVCRDFEVASAACLSDRRLEGIGEASPPG